MLDAFDKSFIIITGFKIGKQALMLDAGGQCIL